MNKGFTLIEMILGAFMGAILLLVIARTFKPAIDFYQRTSARHELENDARKTMETIIRTMRDGKASSLTIDSLNASVIYSSASFTSNNGSAYVIYFMPPTVYLKQTTPAAVTYTTPLASDVTQLSFTGDFRDPSLINVTLRLDKAWDTSGRADHVSTVDLPNQVVHMIPNQ